MAPHSSTLAWKIPWTEEPGAVHGVAKSWTQLSNFTFTFHFHALEKEMATHSRNATERVGMHLCNLLRNDVSHVPVILS